MRENLKEARRKAGMTQKEVAEYLGITVRSYQRIEKGDFLGSISNWDALEDLFKIHQRELRSDMREADKMAELEKADKLKMELERIGRLKKELDRREQVYQEALRLISNLEFKKADELLAKLDDEILESLFQENGKEPEKKWQEKSETWSGSCNTV